MEVTKISLLDPLIEDYLNHPHCFYKNQKINDFDIDIKKQSEHRSDAMLFVRPLPYYGAYDAD
jgi:hypothetical protein